MAKQKSRKSRMSKGGAIKLAKQKAENRAAKFARRAEAGKTYTYKPNPFNKGTEEYAVERNARAQKNRSHKSEVARLTSALRKVDNFLIVQAEEQKKFKEAKKSAKTA